MTAIPKQKRIVSNKTIQECRKDYCEYCGARARGEPHHIRPRSLGGSDTRPNLIQLCAECHTKAHSGKLSHTDLIPIVAKREGVPVEEVYKTIGWPVPSGATLQAEAPGLAPMAGRTLEDIIQLYITLEVNADEVKWQKAAICVALLDGFKMSPAEVSSLLGCSPAYVRIMAKIFTAFPEEESRIPTLSFTHHKVAVQYAPENPQEWVGKAADNEWSTRQLEEAIRSNESREAKQEVRRQKAEKAIRFAKEILQEGGEIAAELRRKLIEIIKEMEKKEAA